MRLLPLLFAAVIGLVALLAALAGAAVLGLIGLASVWRKRTAPSRPIGTSETDSILRPYSPNASEDVIDVVASEVSVQPAAK